MNSFLTSKRLFILCLLICITSLASAAYLQYVIGLEPCPLCLLQRWMLIIITLWLCIALIHGASKIIYPIGLLVFSALGAMIAARQVWLQHLPTADQPACGPSLDFLLENFPVTEALSYVFTGSGECAVIDWTFLGQSIAMWSLLLFLGLFVAGGLALNKGR